MSQLKLNFKWKVEGVLTDVTSVVLADPTNAYGVKRTDTGAVVVAAGTAMSHDATGVYSYTFTEPAAGLTYQWYAKVTDTDGSVDYILLTSQGTAAEDGLPRYLTLAEALALATSLLGVTAWTAAGAVAQNAALAAATFDLDNAQHYQGRKYDLAQVLEFPRVAYESGRGIGPGFGWPTGAGTSGSGCGLVGAVVWDWDSVNNVAIVPQRVKVACLYQANSRLDGKRAAALDKLFRGLKGEATGSLSESFDLATVLAATGGAIDLCRDAVAMMRPYILRQGRIL